MKRLICVLACLVTACGGSKGSGNPTGPGNPTPTKIIRLQATLEFGEVPVGGRAERELRIFNDGTAPLTVTGLTGPSGYTATWTNGTIQPSTSQLSTIIFQPTAAVTYNGTVTVQADHTSGQNTTPISGRGQRELFRRSGVGDTVFDMPLDVARVRIIGTYTGFSSNFIVRVGGRTIVNELLGRGWSSTRYEGTLLTGGGGVTEVRNSSGVSWSFEEIR